MNQFNKKIMIASILLIFGASGQAFAATPSLGNSQTQPIPTPKPVTNNITDSFNRAIDATRNDKDVRINDSFNKAVDVTKNDNDTTTRVDSSAKANDKAAAVGRDGDVTTTIDATKVNSWAKANDKSAAVGRDGDATTTTHTNATKADAHDKAAAVGGNGDATTTANTTTNATKADAHDRAAAVGGNGTATNTLMNPNAIGTGSAASSSGDARSEFKVNISSLSGTVTGQGASATAQNHSAALAANLPVGNHLANAFNGSAGINQNVQNSGNGSLAQQEVSFQGNVTVNPH
ncbi:hypothetical protein [Nitrosomonas sp. Nm33]|uniref:hypothetical protein n=1 Tax=Nitrosomonas sp. Nm33 TaxID=133724 RepID=UPI00089B808A|nr:hypothetical protein [Nitrosomonas sp. Nm33]SDY91639.1 hypothetical protein SAMN05421755_106417 [Nitrosomonas sp. Nm33]